VGIKRGEGACTRKGRSFFKRGAGEGAVGRMGAIVNPKGRKNKKKQDYKKGRGGEKVRIQPNWGKFIKRLEGGDKEITTSKVNGTRGEAGRKKRREFKKEKGQKDTDETNDISLKKPEEKFLKKKCKSGHKRGNQYLTGGPAENQVK